MLERCDGFAVRHAMAVVFDLDTLDRPKDGFLYDLDAKVVCLRVEPVPDELGDARNRSCARQRLKVVLFDGDLDALRHRAMLAHSPTGAAFAARVIPSESTHSDA